MADKDQLKKLDSTLKGLAKEKQEMEASEQSDIEATKLALQAQGVAEMERMANEVVKSNESMLEAVKGLTMNIEAPVIPPITMPEITMPEVKMPVINVPEPKVTVNIPKADTIKFPAITVPEPKVTVNVPDFPEIKMPPIEMPEQMTVQGSVGVTNDRGNPIPMTPVDFDGKPIAMGGGGGGGSRIVKIGETATVKQEVRSVSYKTFEDTNFVAGDSPVTLDCNTALGRNATEYSIQNDGPGDFTVAISNDGTTFGDEKTVKGGEVFAIDYIRVDSIRLTHVADSAYRITVI